MSKLNGRDYTAKPGTNSPSRNYRSVSEYRQPSERASLSGVICSVLAILTIVYFVAQFCR